MIKEKRILTYFILWFIVGVFIFLIGILNVNAATYYMNYEYLQKYYDNNGSSVAAVTTTWNESLQSYVSNNITTISNSYGAGLSITSPIPLIANHTYTLSVYFDGISNIAKSSKNNIAISTSLTGAASNYANNNFYVDMIQTSVSNNSIIQFVFTTKGGGNYIFFPWTTTSNSTHTYVLTQISMEDLGSEGISQQDINNSLNTQTNELNNSIQNSTNIITGEIDDMEQNIIDSNKETQDVIKDQFQTCRPSKNLWPLSTSYTTLTGNEYVLRDTPITIRPGTYTISFKNSSNTRVLFNFKDISGTSKEIYFENNYIQTVTFSNEQVLTAIYIYDRPSTISEIQVQTGTSATKFEEPNQEICTNRIDETNDKLDDTNDKLGDLNDNITNDNIDDNNVSNAFNTFENFIDENATISSLLTLPVTLFSAILNGLQSSCTPFNLGSLYGENLILPCINISSYLGTGLWTMIDIIISGFAIYFISQKFIKVFNNFSSMKEGDVIDD